jgi:hypothetical protein
MLDRFSITPDNFNDIVPSLNAKLSFLSIDIEDVVSIQEIDDYPLYHIVVWYKVNKEV